VYSWINVTLLLLFFFFFSCGLILPILLWFCLLFSVICRISCRIFCSGSLVVVYCFSFCLSWKTFFLHQFWMIALLGRVSRVWNYFLSVPDIPPLMYLLLLRFLLQNIYCYFDGFTFKILFFLSYSLQ
jgi:hypothetical protein